jgi:CubicO group peptidase (beta-lactamase class C family)
MTFDNLDKTIRQLMRKRNTPGMAIGIIQDGERLYSKGFGCKNLKQQAPMTSDTLLGIGSITKSFTAFAIIKLQEQGKLSIEDSAAKYLTFEPFLSRPTIKIRHLLSHSSGVPSLDAGMLEFTYTFDDYRCVYPASSREDFIAHLEDAGDFILFEPGEKFFYNNDMYTCLAFIIEAVSAMSFEQFVQQEILDPLAMGRAVLTKQAFTQDPEQNVMTGYLFEQQDGKKVVKESDIPIGGYLQAPGGLYASINEMLNYAQCLLDEGQFEGQQLLSPGAINQLFTGLISTTYGEGDNPQYALGWTVEAPSENRPYIAIQHGGSVATSQAFLILVPELKLAICAAENASTGISPVACRAAIAMALGQQPDAVLEDIRIDQAVADVEGHYQSPHAMYSLRITRKGAELRADLETDDGSFSFPLVPEDLDSLVFNKCTLKGSKKAKVRFYRNQETQAVEFVAYDRYLYRRC